MPTYEFYCDPDDGGCGNVIEINCLFSKKEKLKPKSCKKCRKRKALRELFGTENAIHMPKTLGSLADKRSTQISEDEKQAKTKKFNEYKEGNNIPSWTSTPDGMVHRSQIHE